MARNVNVRNGLVEDLRALAKQVVDRAVHHFLIARDRRCREDDGVVWLDTHHAMVLVGDAGEGRGRLSLAAGTDDDDLLRQELIDVFSANQHALGNVQVSKLYRHLHVVDHTASNHGDHALVAHGGIDNLLYSRDERGEGSDEDTPGGIGKDFVERVIDHTFRRRITRGLYARAIAHHHQDAFIANTC